MNNVNREWFMDTRKYLTCLWPGLSELWWRGRLSALPLAIGFAIGLDSLLILKFFYPTWIAPFVVQSAWWIGVVGWICWTAKSVRELPELLTPRVISDEPDRFTEAQTAYMTSDWKQAEKLLLGILSIEPRDPPALLLLSGVYRHSGRCDSAAALIEELRRLEVADSWAIEIEAESRRIKRDFETVSERFDAEPPSEKSTDSDAADLTAA